MSIVHNSKLGKRAFIRMSILLAAYGVNGLMLAGEKSAPEAAETVRIFPIGDKLQITDGRLLQKSEQKRLFQGRTFSEAVSQGKRIKYDTFMIRSGVWRIVTFDEDNNPKKAYSVIADVSPEGTIIPKSVKRDGDAVIFGKPVLEDHEGIYLKFSDIKLWEKVLNSVVKGGK